MLKALFRFSAFLGLICFFIVHHGVAAILIRSEERRHRFFLNSTRNYALLASKILNIRVTPSHVKSDVRESLIVSNHLSYVDVLILAVAYPSLFVTSKEIRETPVLGLVTKLAGCFFVERRRSRITPGTKISELSLMKEKIAQGFNVFLFPEGTSSDGSSVLPFKVTFFQLAADAGIRVLPVCLKYTGQAQEKVPWYGDMTFPDHLFRLCFLDEIHVELKELVAFTGQDKFELSHKAFEQIRLSYG